MLIALYLVQSLYFKMNQQEIPSIPSNVLEIFSVPLYTDYLADLQKKFQEASTYDTNVECQIWEFLL